MTDQLRQAAQQALEALETYKGFIDDAHIIEGQWHWLDGSDNAITALREALEQPEQEPTCPECKAAVLYECVACSSNNYPPKPEQEPVAKLFGTLPVYDTPPAAQPEQEPDDGFDIDGLKDAAYALEAILQRAGEGATVGHVIALLENLAQPEQVVDCPRCGHVCSQLPWVGLTEDEKTTAIWTDGGFGAGALWAETKLKERNNG
jgi:hypothetical protein